jgi:hypothetical protein
MPERDAIREGDYRTEQVPVVDRRRATGLRPRVSDALRAAVMREEVPMVLRAT